MGIPVTWTEVFDEAPDNGYAWGWGTPLSDDWSSYCELNGTPTCSEFEYAVKYPYSASKFLQFPTFITNCGTFAEGEAPTGTTGDIWFGSAINDVFELPLSEDEEYAPNIPLPGGLYLVESTYTDVDPTEWGIIFRAVDHDNYYYAGCHYSYDRFAGVRTLYYFIGRRIGGVNGFLAVTPNLALGEDAPGPRTTRVHLVGDTITLDFDPTWGCPWDDLVVTDATLAGTKIGVFATVPYSSVYDPNQGRRTVRWTSLSCEWSRPGTFKDQFPVHVTTDSDNTRYATKAYEFGAGVPLERGNNGQLVIKSGATVSRLADDVLLVGVAT